LKWGIRGQISGDGNSLLGFDVQIGYFWFFNERLRDWSDILFLSQGLLGPVEGKDKAESPPALFPLAATNPIWTLAPKGKRAGSP
jgi:hypothetical protein